MEHEIVTYFLQKDTPWKYFNQAAAWQSISNMYWGLSKVSHHHTWSSVVDVTFAILMNRKEVDAALLKRKI